MGKLMEICGSTREKNATDANGSALQQPAICQRPLPGAAACPVSTQPSRRKDYQLQGNICTPLKHSETSCARGEIMSDSSLGNMLTLSE